ncbi:MAG: M28 family metallopeptidase [Pseudomonadota bacterium]
MIRLILSASMTVVLSACGQDAEAPAINAPDDVTPAQVKASLQLPMPLPKDTSVGVTEADLHQRIRLLSDDAFEGRAPAAEKGELTADWLAAEMGRIGLQPAGEDGTWFQTVGMVEQTLDANASSLVFNGGASGDPFPVELGPEAVLWTKKQDRNDVSWQDSELVFVGYGVVAPEYDWNDYAGLNVAGKTVVMLVNDPGYARGDELFKGQAMTYYGRWTYKFEEAGRQGATGAIVVHEAEPASYGWEVVANSWSGAQADLVRADGGADRTAFEAWISEETARSLFAEAGLNFSEMKRLAKREGFVPVDMGNVTASGSLTQLVTTTESRNVAGVLPGRTAPDEHVLFTAHWDHLGKKSDLRDGAPTQDFYRDSVFNGAVDNATGTAALLEMAEAMAAEELDRSALFLAVTLEESGLLGSAYYAENPTVPMHKIVAGLNMDAMLPMGRTKDMIVVGYGASELEDLLKEELQAVGRVVVPDPNPQAGYFYRSDHVSFAKKGVPMLYADGGTDKIDGGLAAGLAFSDTYRTRRYHKPMDEYSENWDVSGIREDVLALLAVGLRIAQSDIWPTWYPGNEFEAIRKASLAQQEG